MSDLAVDALSDMACLLISIRVTLERNERSQVAPMEVPMKQQAEHKHTERRLICMKHQTVLQGDSAHCRDPKIYCKFRTGCPVWFMEKRGGKNIDAY